MTAAAIEPRFKSISELLSFAFAMQAKKVHPSGSQELQSRGTNPADLTMYERIAEGMMYYHAAMSALRGRVGLQLAVKAWYTMDRDKDLDGIKMDSAKRLARLIQNTRPGIKDPFCAEDLIMGWAYNRGGFFYKAHTYDWWADHLGVPRSRLVYWATHNGSRSKGMIPTADLYLSDAERVIEDELSYYRVV